MEKFTVTLVGPQGCGKSMLFETLKKAGWYVSDEIQLKDATGVTAVVKPPKRKK